jgi:membrane protein
MGMVLTALEQYTEHFLPGSDSRLLWRLIQIGATFCLNTALFTLMYHWLPKENFRLRDALRGGLIAAIVWEIGREILSAFLIGTRYTNAYGVVGSFIGLMLWFYYAIAVLLLGAEYIQVSSKPKAESRPQDASQDKPTYETPATQTSPAPPAPAPSLETETAIGERSIKVTLGLLLDH